MAPVRDITNKVLVDAVAKSTGGFDYGDKTVIRVIIPAPYKQPMYVMLL